MKKPKTASITDRTPTLPPPPTPHDPVPSPPEPAKPPRPASLRELNDICRSKIDALVRTPRGVVTIEVFPLSPNEAAQVDDLMNSVLPPFALGADGQPSERLDIQNAEYLKRKDEATRKARSLGLWTGVPILREGAPPATAHTHESIHAWIQSQTSDSVLEQLWGLLSSDCVPARLEEQVRFFTSPA